jgi:hypothetical protein
LALVALLVNGILFTPLAGAKPGHVFGTWAVFEEDKCASIWLIKRFIDRNAVIRFFPKDEPISEGIPFDTPDAALRRYHNLSTFECLLRHYHLTDPRLMQIGRIIHDIEINTWQRKRFPESHAVQTDLSEMIKESGSPDEITDRCIRYFDALYEKIGIEGTGSK